MQKGRKRTPKLTQKSTNDLLYFRVFESHIFLRKIVAIRYGAQRSRCESKNNNGRKINFITSRTSITSFLFIHDSFVLEIRKWNLNKKEMKFMIGIGENRKKRRTEFCETVCAGSCDFAQIDVGFKLWLTISLYKWLKNIK